MKQTKKQFSTDRSLSRRIFSYALVLSVLAFAALMFVPPIFGMKHYVIIGKSMTGTIDKGSLIYDENVPVKDLKVGDIITYTPPAGTGPNEPITHRIVNITKSEKGPVFKTKGDANPTVDPWEFTLDKPTQAKESFHIPYVGYGLAALSVPQVRMALIGIPALTIAILLLLNIWRESGKYKTSLSREASYEESI